MKISRLLTVCLSLALSFGVLAPATARADEPASFDYFYDALQPYGQWVDVAGYGYCWQPNGVDENWQPYSDGYWAYTDAGWTWVSYEDFGWITYHYGRWTRVEDLGWVWVPDYEWAPAWVSWRENDDYVGWAPLPPECHFQADIGVSFWVDSTCDIGPGSYNFCLVSDFGSPALRSVIITRNRNVTIIANTINITNITVNNNFIFNGGPKFEVLSRRVARPIQVMRLVRETNAAAFGHGHPGFAQARGGELFIAAPTIVKPSHPFHPAKVARVVTNVKVDHGWAHVADPGVKQQLQEKIKAQSRGVKPEQAPAKAVTAQQLSIIQNRNNTPAPGAQTSGTPILMHPPIHILKRENPGATPVPPGQLQPFQTNPGGTPHNPTNGTATPGGPAAVEHEKKFQGRQETNVEQQKAVAAAAAAAAREQQLKAAEAAARQQQLMQQKAAEAAAAHQQQQHFQQQNQRNGQQGGARGAKPDTSPSPVR